MIPKPCKSGKHVTKRHSIQLPQGWGELLSQLARKSKQPMSWYIIDQISKDATKERVKKPSLPWE